MVNLALVAPSIEKSETFIQSHRDGIKANVFFYHGGLIPNHLDGQKFANITIGKTCFHRPFQFLRQLIQINPYAYLKSNLSFSEYLLTRSWKEHKINVVLAEYGTVSTALMESCKNLGIPLVPHFHGFDCSVYSVVEEYGEKYRQLFDYCPYVVVVSQEMKRKLISLGCDESKIVYAPCAPDKKYYELHPDYARLQFYSIGRFVDKKAHYITILAFKKVHDCHPEARLVMAGDGVLWATCKNLANILGLSEAVTFPGAINPEQNMQYMETSLAYVQHSVIALNGDMEGTPVAIMEASATGIPVVSTYHAGIPDVIVNGETGLLCKEYDVDTMSENMLRVLEDHDFAVRLGKNGKKRMKELFSKEEQIRTLTETINKAAILL